MTLIRLMTIHRHLLILTVGKHGSQAFDTGKPDETRRKDSRHDQEKDAELTSSSHRRTAA